MEEKTNAMRLLDQKKIPYRTYAYKNDGTLTGEEIARLLDQNPNQVFKTLVTVGKSGKNYVFLVPVGEELDKKKAAASVGEKSIDMVKSKELLPLTGYIHGGCSPIGMKKLFPTTLHSSALDFEQILFSGGRIGRQLEVAPEDLKKLLPYRTADIIARKEEN